MNLRMVVLKAAWQNLMMNNDGMWLYVAQIPNWPIPKDQNLKIALTVTWWPLQPPRMGPIVRATSLKSLVILEAAHKWSHHWLEPAKPWHLEVQSWSLFRTHSLGCLLLFLFQPCQHSFFSSTSCQLLRKVSQRPSRLKLTEVQTSYLHGGWGREMAKKAGHLGKNRRFEFKSFPFIPISQVQSL